MRNEEVDSTMIALSVIVPVRDGGSNLARCLEAVTGNDLEAGFEVVVVDDHTRDGSVESIRDRLSREGLCRVISLDPDRCGPAAARNCGAAESRGALLLFLDADVIVAPDTLKKFVETFRERPEVDAIFGSYTEETEFRDFFSRYKNLQHHYTHQISSEAAATFWSGCGAIRRDAFEAAGGFDEGYDRPCIEDIALGYTLTAQGRRILLRKDIQVRHLKQYTFTGLIRSDLLHRAVPWTRLMLERRIFRSDLNTKGNNILSVALSFALTALVLVGFRLPAAFGGAALLFVVFLALNYDYFTYVHRRTGLFFTVGTVAMTVLFYLYSGLGLGIGLYRHIRGA